VCEALACGVPVVATRVGEVENMVPPESGIVFDQPENVAEIARCVGAALRKKWDRHAIRAAAERNTWDSVAVRVVQAWRSAAPPVTHAVQPSAMNR